MPSWTEAFALALPLVLLYAYFCLAAWYVCRMVPIAAPRPVEVALAHGAGAILSSALWLAIGFGWASALASVPAFARAREDFAAAIPQTAAAAGLLYLLNAAVYYLIFALESAGQAERRELDQRLVAREAELRALKAQLDPHFLFNSLNTVSALTGSDPQAARKVTILLAEFLRRSLRAGNHETIPLAEELALVGAYLAVERARFGERLRVEQTIDETSQDCATPPLILQPLVENAVRHGIAQLLEGGAIRIEARQVATGNGPRLLLAVENPCDPTESGERDARGATTSRGEGVGLANVEARLRACFGPEGRVRITALPGSFRVELAMPACRHPAAAAAGAEKGGEGASGAADGAAAGVRLPAPPQKTAKLAAVDGRGDGA
ncbi:MAG TPA: histidine kinase [Thermoanaerobaculia bacterium]|nr:histidine kinase [Thermoanaerobaculia bacterium]